MTFGFYSKEERIAALLIETLGCALLKTQALLGSDELEKYAALG